MENIEARSAKDLIYLVSCAVNNEKPDAQAVAAMDMDSLYKTAVEHCLVVAASYAIESVTKLPPDFFQAKYQAIRRLSLFDIERKKITAKLEENGIWYLPLKGAVIKSDYPKTVMREMSDNDILFDRERADDVKRIMVDMGYLCTRYGTANEDIYHKRPFVIFEMHRTLFSEFRHPELYAHYANIKSRLVSDEGKRFGYHMTDEDFYAYIVCHLYKHYIQGGTGLRSLLDIYIFNRAHRDKLDPKALAAELKRQNLTDFEKTVRELAQKVFTRQQLNEAEEKELEYFISSDCFGTDDNKLAHKLGNDDSKTAKRAYVRSRIFLSDAVLQESHPVVYRHKILYPFFVTGRIVKAVATKPKRVIGEYKSVKSFRKKENHGSYNE